MVEILVSYWGGLFSGPMLVSGRVPTAVPPPGLPLGPVRPLSPIPYGPGVPVVVL